VGEEARKTGADHEQGFPGRHAAYLGFAGRWLSSSEISLRQKFSKNVRSTKYLGLVIADVTNTSHANN
jgi:hypothetical protein